MINDFYLNSQFDDPIRISPNLDFWFEGLNLDSVNNYINSSSKFLEWKYLGKKIYINEEKCEIIGLPSKKYDRVIAIYLNSSKFLSPANAVIYNENGTIDQILTVPKPISKFIKNIRKFNNNVNNFEFTHLRWDLKSTNTDEIIITFKNKAGIFREDRILNVYTGSFGESVYSVEEYK